MVGLGRDCEGRGNKGSKQRWLRWSEWLKIFHKLQKHFSNGNQRECVWRFWNPLSTPYLSSSDHIGAIIDFYLEGWLSGWVKFDPTRWFHWKMSCGLSELHWVNFWSLFSSLRIKIQ